MDFKTVNTYALKSALVLMFGDEAFGVVEKVYNTINTAQRDAYAAGVTDGLQQSEERVNAAFDEGWKYGEAEAKDEAEVEIDAAYDNGYVDGVADARARPDVADETVQDIIGEAAANAFNGEVEVIDEDFDDDWCPICQQHGCMVVDD